jgi:hypothetical protein
MGIALVPDIEHNTVFFRNIDSFQRDGELHRAEVGGEMPAGLRYVFNQKFPDLRAELSARPPPEGHADRRGIDLILKRQINFPQKSNSELIITKSAAVSIAGGFIFARYPQKNE